MPNYIITALTVAAERLEELGLTPTAAEVVDHALEFGSLTPVRNDADEKRLCRITEHLLEARKELA